MSNELKWAHAHYAINRPHYALYGDFYDGKQGDYLKDHWYYKKNADPFSAWMADVVDNLMPSVVDSFADRLQVAGVTSDSEAAQEFIDSFWKVNRLDGKAGFIHSEAIKLGDAYVTVWTDRDGQVRLYPERTNQIAVKYAQDDTGESVVEAVKCWCDEAGHLRVTRYLPDRTERYISAKPTTTLPASLSELLPYVSDGVDAVITNPYGRVPIFHFSNSGNPDRFAQSELKDAVPLQTALNQSLRAMLAGQEMTAWPVRYMIGFQASIDPATGKPPQIEVGPGAFLQFAGENVKIGQLDPPDIEQFLKIQDSFRIEIARVTRTPVHLLTLNSGDFPSGEALKTAEAPLIAKVRDRQISFGDVWEDVLSFACRLAGIDPGYVEAHWTDTAPRSEKDQSEAAVNKLAVGVSKAQIMRELGYSQAQIDAMVDENEADTQSMGDRLLQAFDGGKGTN